MFLFLAPFVLRAQIITTVAGNGMPGETGDGGDALAAKIYYPTYVTLDNYGNYYFTENIHHKVRRVSRCGIITTIAGTGTGGYNGDNIPATAAELNGPLGIAIDSAGNIYINDCSNNRIRKINSLGIITTVCGTGTAGYGGDGSPATSAMINGAADVACDRIGNIYVSDHSNYRIRKINNSGIISTYVGTGVSGMSGDGGLADTAKIGPPGGLACDTSGNLFFVDGSNRIRKVDAATHIINTLAGTGSVGSTGDGGPATSAEFENPCAITTDLAGNIYITDILAENVRMVDTSGIIHTIAGTGMIGFSGDGGPATTAELYYPEGVACDKAGNLLIADFANQRIRKIIYNTADTLSISISGVSSASVGSSVIVSAIVNNAGSSFLIKWLNHGIEFMTTTTPSVTYTKGAGTDVISAQVFPTDIGCHDSAISEAHIVTTVSTGLSIYNMQQAVIYPNPTTNLLQIDNLPHTASYSLLTIVGATMQQGTLHRGSNTIALGTLPTGMYLLQLIDEEGNRSVSKVMKE